jgi:hypothetical protein
MLDQLGQLGLSGMAQAFAELEASDETAALTHADWLGLLLDRELTHRRDKRLAARLRYARLRQQASVEDVDYRAPRGLERALFQKLTNGEWIDALSLYTNPPSAGPGAVRRGRDHSNVRAERSQSERSGVPVSIQISDRKIMARWARRCSLAECDRLHTEIGYRRGFMAVGRRNISARLRTAGP